MRVLITGISGFAGSFLAELCLEKGAQVFGFDRARPAIEKDRETFVAPNLRFDWVDLGDVLDRAGQSGGAVAIAHVRTCSMIYPAGVEAFYRQCAQAGVEFILGVEGSGYSFATQRFTDSLDPERPAVVPQGLMIDHNYPRLLDQAGFEIIDSGIFPYLQMPPVRWLQHLISQFWFVARRRPA